MNYRVVYRQSVWNKIHSLAFVASELGRDGAALTRAADDIALALGDNPAELGESRSGHERVFIVHPLAVTYEVFEAAQVVVIYSGVYYPRRQL